MNQCRLNVILDLDNTLINALEDSDRKNLPIDVSGKFKFKDYIPFFRIFVRPHLQTFLDYLFANFNVAVMTAAEKDYALFIIDNFILTKPGRKLSFVFYRYQVDLSREIYGGMKDLNIIWDFFKINGFYKYNTIIVDDLDLVYETNPYNTIRIPGFFIVDEDTRKVNYDALEDDDLLDVMAQLQYLKEIYTSSNCRASDKAILEYA